MRFNSLQKNGSLKNCRGFMLLRHNVKNRQASAHSRWHDYCQLKLSIIKIVLAYSFDQKNHMLIFHYGPTNWHCWQKPMCGQSKTEKQSNKICTNESQASLCKCHLPLEPHSETTLRGFFVTMPAVWGLWLIQKIKKEKNKTNSKLLTELFHCSG